MKTLNGILEKRLMSKIFSETGSEIVFLNDRYAKKRLYAGYIGTVLANCTEEGFVVVQVRDPVTDRCIALAEKVGKGDFRFCSDSAQDRKAKRDFYERFLEAHKDPSFMNRFEDNSFADESDDIILLNDNYRDIGLRKGDIGIIMENRIEGDGGYVIADFPDPVTGEPICPVAEIGKDDFRVYNDSPEDRKIGADFRNRFRKKET